MCVGGTQRGMGREDDAGEHTMRRKTPHEKEEFVADTPDHRLTTFVRVQVIVSSIQTAIVLVTCMVAVYIGFQQQAITSTAARCQSGHTPTAQGGARTDRSRDNCLRHRALRKDAPHAGDGSAPRLSEQLVGR